MKLLRYGELGLEKPGVLDKNGNIRDLSLIINDINQITLAEPDFLEKLMQIDLNTLPLIENNVRIGACVSLVSKVICVGFNSLLHVTQMGHKPVENNEIIVFLKAGNAVSGANDPILYTKYNQKVDWEAELGVVIGKKGKYIQECDALDYIFGYTCVNDISDRYWQFETIDSQYTKGKGFDSFAPIGPYLVTKDEILDASNLNVKLAVNGEIRQDFNTSDYINNPAKVISYLSQFFTLMPGDIVSMGSGPGNAKHWGGKFLQPGDKLVLEIEGLGKQEQQVISE